MSITRRDVLIAPFLLLAAVSLPAQQKTCPAFETNAADSQFKPGQIWAYKTRIGETASTLTILQAGRLPKLVGVVHVRIDHLAMHNPAGDLVPAIEHKPFTREAMLGSVTRLIGRQDVLPTLEGYERWRADCGGVYSIGVADAVAVTEKTFHQP